MNATMYRGSWVALLLLLGAGLAATAGTSLGQSTDCGLAMEQNDARLGQDAPADPGLALGLPYEDEYPASISYPQGPVVDNEDWFNIAWDASEEHRVMVNLSTRALGLTYLTDGMDPVPAQRLPAAHLGLEAYKSGDDTPTHVGESEDGVVRLDFDTTHSSWDIRVFLPHLESEEKCPASQSLAASPGLQSYNLYWGCQPHCMIEVS